MPNISAQTALTIFSKDSGTFYGKECGKILSEQLGEESFQILLRILDTHETKSMKDLITIFYEGIHDNEYFSDIPEEDVFALIKKSRKMKRTPMDMVMELYNSENETLVKGAKEIVVNDYSQFIYEIIHKRYSTYSENIWEEMFQTGCIGLLEALKNYNPESGAFTTYSQFFIMHQISKQINFHNNNTTIYYNKIQKEISSAQADLENMGITPTIRTISLWTGITPEIVQREKETVEKSKLVYLNDDESSISLSLQDYRASPEDIYQEREKYDMISKGIDALPEIIRSAILMREESSMTNAEIARELGISIGQLKNNYQTGMKMLRNDPNLRNVFNDYIASAENILYSEEFRPERSKKEVSEMIDNLLEITAEKKNEEGQ